jgi:hypothetical protein
VTPLQRSSIARPPESIEWRANGRHLSGHRYIAVHIALDSDFYCAEFRGLVMVSDLNGDSAADFFVLAHWSVSGLRVYLWLEGGLLAAGLITLSMATLVLLNSCRYMRLL